jgi:hypothetical protein
MYLHIQDMHGYMPDCSSNNLLQCSKGSRRQTRWCKGFESRDLGRSFPSGSRETRHKMYLNQLQIKTSSEEAILGTRMTSKDTWGRGR